MLIKVSVKHPQALVCPISVAVNTNDPQQKAVAKEILSKVRIQDSRLVDEAQIISKELMRVAITPHELWHDGLEKPAQLYKEKDIEGMIAKLQELHSAMDDAPSSGGDLNVDGFSEKVGRVGRTTLRDISFRHSYGKEISEARYWLNQFARTYNLFHLHQVGMRGYHKILSDFSFYIQICSQHTYTRYI